MNVHITAFESYNEEEVTKILEILREVKGTIEFKYLPYHRETFEFLDFNKKERFDQEDILDISQSLRNTNDDIDYLVILTSKGLDIPVVSLPKEKDWYSVFVSRNIAVHISDRWESVIKDKPYLAAAHQIVENVFQGLSHMELNSQIQLDKVDLKHGGLQQALQYYIHLQKLELLHQFVKTWKRDLIYLT